MKFTIEQIAICPKNPIAAKKLLTEIGAVDWVEDHVVELAVSLKNQELMKLTCHLIMIYSLAKSLRF